MPKDKPVKPKRPTPAQLLRRLMTCFYEQGNELHWSYKEGYAVRDVLDKEIENELKEYMS